MIDYDKYQFRWYEYIETIGISVLIISSVSYLFFDNILIAIFLSPFSYFYFQITRKSKVKKRKQQLSIQFKDAMISISSELEAGYSIENAFIGALRDLSLIYNKESYIIREIQRIVFQINNNMPIENALEDFTKRSHIADIQCFYEVFLCGKRTGGDMIQIIKKTCRTIGHKMEVYREIDTMITAKKFEITIMRVVPFAIITYLRLCNPGFLSPLYHNVFGYLFMTAMLAGILLLCVLSERIMNIEI